MKYYFALFYFNFNIIISFIFYYTHNCCFNIFNNPYNKTFQTCYPNSKNTGFINMQGIVGDKYIIEKANGHGKFISGYLDFGNDCIIKIPTKNLIKNQYITPTGNSYNVYDIIVENLTVQNDKDWYISFFVHKFPSLCDKNVFIYIKTNDINLLDYIYFPSISIENLYDDDENIDKNNNYIVFNSTSDNIHLYNDLNQSINFQSNIDFRILKIIKIIIMKKIIMIL